MKLSEGVEWGLHCVTLLAGLPPATTMPTRALAEYHGVSETYLAKHLQALTNARIIESLPGPRGGYRLSRPPAEITLLEVVEAIDGREPVFHCMEIRQRGPLAGPPTAYRIPCGIHVAMARAEKAWREALRSQTITDLIAQYHKDAGSKHLQRSEQWMEEHMRLTPDKTNK